MNIYEVSIRLGGKTVKELAYGEDARDAEDFVAVRWLIPGYGKAKFHAKLWLRMP